MKEMDTPIFTTNNNNKKYGRIREEIWTFLSGKNINIQNKITLNLNGMCKIWNKAKQMDGGRDMVKKKLGMREGGNQQSEMEVGKK